MKPFRFLMLSVVALASACSSSGTDAVRLVQDADELMRGHLGPNPAGGLEFPSVRTDMKAMYDEAIRLTDDASLNQQDLAFVLSHAHFGLAMNRLFDLADRVKVIFETGGVLQALRGEGGSLDDANAERPGYCVLFEDFEALESIVELLVETALDPIIDDLRAALAADPNMSVTIERARYDLSDFTAESNPEGNYLELAAVYSAPDIYLILGVVELITGLSEFAFAFNNLFANVFLFGFVSDTPAQFQIAKLFNSNPCVDYPTDGNPLLDPEFGVLEPGAGERLARAQELVGDGFLDLANALNNAASDSPDSHLVGTSGQGTAWATGLVDIGDGKDRFSLAPGSGDTPLQGLDTFWSLLVSFVEVMSPLVPIDDVAGVMQGLGNRVKEGGVWNMSGAIRTIVPDDDLVDFATQWIGADSDADIPALDELETAFIDFGILFESPPGDLKTILPAYYKDNEYFVDVQAGTQAGAGRRDPAAEGTIIRREEDYNNSEPYTDQNCNGRWDQIGDFIVVHELEPYADADNNRQYSKDTDKSPPDVNGLPGTLGIVGGFLDEDADGVPDRPAVDGTADREKLDPQSPACRFNAPVTWPGAAQDPNLGAYVVSRLTTPDDEYPFGQAVTQAVVGDTAPFDNEQELGKIIGHYWRPAVFSCDVDNCTGLGNWPQGARTDPANGVFDADYFFFPDPSLGGLLYRNSGGTPDPSATTNGWLNRFITQWNSIQDAFGL